MAILDPASSEEESSTSTSRRNDNNQLIPGLPNDVAELCLLHLPYPYQALVRSVSSSWNKAITDPTFLLSKKSLFLSLPYLFVFSFRKSTARVQFQALDPRSGRWFVLPPMPSPNDAVLCPSAFTCASLPRHGKLVVLGGVGSGSDRPTGNTMVYRTSTNQWSESSPMTTPRLFFDAGTVAGRIIAVGGNSAAGEMVRAVESYDHESETWTPAAELPAALSRFSSAVVGGKLYVTEGWTWPFMFSPRGAVYDAERDTWRQMKQGMRDGWTGVSAVVGDRLVVISEHGDCPMKVYDEDHDAWHYVGGEKFPCDVLRRPFAATGLDGKIYVISSGLSMGIGNLYDGGNGEVEVTWRVMPAPSAFQGFSPSSCQVLYA